MPSNVSDDANPFFADDGSDVSDDLSGLDSDGLGSLLVDTPSTMNPLKRPGAANAARRLAARPSDGPAFGDDDDDETDEEDADAHERMVAVLGVGRALTESLRRDSTSSSISSGEADDPFADARVKAIMSEAIQMGTLTGTDEDGRDDPSAFDFSSSDAVYEQQPLRVRLRSMMGLGFVALSALTFSTMSMLINIAGQHCMSSLEITFFRAFVMWLFTLGVMVRQWRLALARGEDTTLGAVLFGRPENRRLLWARGIIVSFALVCVIYALTHMALGDASVLVFTAPIFTALFARILIKEPLGAVDYSAMLLSIVGVVLVAKPPFIFGGSGERVLDDGCPDDGTTAEDDEDSSSAAGAIAAVIALMGAMGSGFSNVILRKLKNENSMVAVQYMAMCSSILAPVLLLVSAQKVNFPSAIQWLLMIAIGFLGFLGQVFVTKGIQMEAAGPAAMMRNLDILFAYIYQVALLGQPANGLSILGACFVVTCAVIIGTRKWLSTKRRA